MLYIHARLNQHSDSKYCTCRFDSKLKTWDKSLGKFCLRFIYEIQADGDELEFIREKFTNIPMTNCSTVRWHDDMARYIVDNLRIMACIPSK